MCETQGTASEEADPTSKLHHSGKVFSPAVSEVPLACSSSAIQFRVEGWVELGVVGSSKKEYAMLLLSIKYPWYGFADAGSRSNYASADPLTVN